MIMKKLFLSLSIFLLAVGCMSQPVQESGEQENTHEIQEESVYHNFVDVKYRDDDVDIADLEALDTSSSSLVRGAWYDDDNDYMVINLSGTYYHYCGLSDSKWDGFSSADSFGSYYNKHLKGNFDCRYNYVPNY